MERLRRLSALPSVLLLVACGVPSSSSGSESATAISAQPSQTASALPSETVTTESTEPTPLGTTRASEEGIVGAPFASVLVNGLALRLEPGTAAGQVSCAPDAPVRLNDGDIVLVLPDPPAVDETSTWHRVVAPASDGAPGVGTPCDDVPFVVGWVATGLGEPWISADIDCPDLPRDLDGLAAASAEPLLVLACFGSSDMVVQGKLAPPPAGGIGLSCPGIEPNWLTCGIDRIADGGSGIPIRIPPGTSLPLDTGIEITLQADHSAAHTCNSLVESRYAPEAVAAFCRVQLVAANR